MLLPDEHILLVHDAIMNGPFHLAIYATSLILTGIGCFAYGTDSLSYGVVMCAFGSIMLVGSLFVALAGKSKETLVVTSHRVYYRYVTHYPGIDVKQHTDRMFSLKDTTSVATAESRLYIILFYASLFFLGTGVLTFTPHSSPATAYALVVGILCFLTYILVAYRFRKYYLKLYFKSTGGSSPVYVGMPLAKAAHFADRVWALCAGAGIVDACSTHT